MALRVVVGYTGGVGSTVVRLVQGNPAFELVGVLVHSEDKDGKDAGDIVGIPPTGVIATRDVDALIALKADVLAWHGIDWQPELIARFLRAGTSVYSSHGGWFLPSEPSYDLIQAAGEEGGSALIAGGNIPGLISDVLPLFATGYSADVTFVRAWQKDHVPNYPSAYQLGEFLGFGQEIPDHVDLDGELSFADASWQWCIGQSAQIVAQALGIPYDGTKLTKKEFGAAPEDITLQPSGLVIPKGHVAGARWTLTAYSNGKPFYELVNEQSAVLGLGDDWRSDINEPNWRVVVDGSPSIELQFGLPGSHDGPDHVAALNAARAVACLPRVAAAQKTGWVTVLDLPAPVGVASAALQA
ncbi:dihydrodipicolinate reductase [Frankia sp. QA3]|uniref:dihydrodipicolinate reductase n=1 Tax=Frankia sp. QA3 TaxID=710111 RepID=UPI000269BFDE|nr:dihydrodipicolinate reductase [Frankia sp. QA3]EIV92454.1 hypothetical protein FraQA3DRAFT_2021 [Frankia sp. QA3]